VVAGLKPATEMSIDDDPCVRDALEKLAEGKRAGRIVNTELAWTYTPSGSQHPHPFILSIFNLRVLESLRTSPEFLKLLDQFRIPIPSSSEEVMELYHQAVFADGYRYYGPPWANAIVGSILGYPIKDVLAYVNSLQSAQFTARRGVCLSPARWLSVSGFANFSDQTLPVIMSKQVLLEIAAKNYFRARNLGFTALQVFNHPEWIRPFPKPEDAIAVENTLARVYCQQLLMAPHSIPRNLIGPWRDIN
jgi:hypothetical protein